MAPPSGSGVGDSRIRVGICYIVMIERERGDSDRLVKLNGRCYPEERHIRSWNGPNEFDFEQLPNRQTIQKKGPRPITKGTEIGYGIRIIVIAGKSTVYSVRCRGIPSTGAARVVVLQWLAEKDGIIDNDCHRIRHDHSRKM